MKKQWKLDNKGMTLLEVIVAFAIFAIAATILITGFNGALKVMGNSAAIKDASQQSASDVEIQDEKARKSAGEATFDIGETTHKVQGTYYLAEIEKNKESPDEGSIIQEEFVPDTAEKDKDDEGLKPPVRVGGDKWIESYTGYTPGSSDGSIPPSYVWWGEPRVYYVCIQNPGVNIWSPDTVVALWQVTNPPFNGDWEAYLLKWNITSYYPIDTWVSYNNKIYSSLNNNNFGQKPSGQAVDTQFWKYIGEVPNS